MTTSIPDPMADAALIAAVATSDTGTENVWAVSELEPLIRDLRGSPGALRSMALSERAPRVEDWLAVIEPASDAVDNVKALWKQAWEQSVAERQATEAALKSAQAERAVPGGKAGAKGRSRAAPFLKIPQILQEFRKFW